MRGDVDQNHSPRDGNQHNVSEQRNFNSNGLSTFYANVGSIVNKRSKLELLDLVLVSFSDTVSNMALLNLFLIIMLSPSQFLVGLTNITRQKASSEFQNLHAPGHEFGINNNFFAHEHTSGKVVSVEFP